MTQYHPPPALYQFQGTQYPQFGQQRSGFALALEQGFAEPVKDARKVTYGTELESGMANGIVLNGGKTRRSSENMEPERHRAGSRRRKSTSTITPHMLKMDPIAHSARQPPFTLPTPTLPTAMPILPPPTRSSTIADPSTTSQRDQAVEEYIVLELRREKERKRKADYRARKRREALGLSPVVAVEAVVAEESTETEDEDEQQSDTSESLQAESTDHLQHQQQTHQQASDDQQWSRRSPPYSGRASSAPVGTVPVRVGDRIVGIELEQVEKMIREQHALQQAQQQMLNAAEEESISSTTSAPEPFRYHGQLPNTIATSVCIEDDRKAFEAYLATASRDVPLPNGTMGGLPGGVMAFDGSNQHDHALSTMTLANGLAAYGSLPLSASSSSFPPISHLCGDNAHPSPAAASTLVPLPKQPRQLTNWFQPILWTMIDETAEKFGFDKAPLIARHLRETVSPRIFGRLGERQVRKWINPEKTGWKASVVDKVARQELLAHVQAGLITVPTASGVNVNDGSATAFRDCTNKGGEAETKTTMTAGSSHNTRKHSLRDSSTGQAKVEDGGPSKRQRRKKNHATGERTTTANGQKDMQLSPTLVLNQALL